jgi:hypothetical protein
MNTPYLIRNNMCQLPECPLNPQYSAFELRKVAAGSILEVPNRFALDAQINLDAKTGLLCIVPTSGTEMARRFGVHAPPESKMERAESSS